MVKEEPSVYRGDVFQKLAQSRFRSGFSLKTNDRAYVREKGMDTVKIHAVDIVGKRLSPGNPANDGKQTPMRGHPVFVAQHATATCCRGCLEKWHGIPRGIRLTEEQQEYVVGIIMEWIKRQMKESKK